MSPKSSKVDPQLIKDVKKASKLDGEIFNCNWPWQEHRYRLNFTLPYSEEKSAHAGFFPIINACIVSSSQQGFKFRLLNHDLQNGQTLFLMLINPPSGMNLEQVDRFAMI